MYEWLIFRLFAGNSEFAPECSGNDDVHRGVETDGQLKGRLKVDNRILVPLAGEPHYDVSQAVHSPASSSELLEQTFDDGNSCVEMRISVVMFLVHSKFLTKFVPLRHIRR